MQNLLEYDWQFWLVLVTQTSAGSSQYQIEEITSVSTVENFFQYFTALPSISELRNVHNKRPSIALFRKGIRPAWEDPKNASGGNFMFLVPREVVNDVWRDLLLSAIGGTLGDHITPGNRVNGLVVSPRKNPEGYYGIDIWVKRAEPEDAVHNQMTVFLDNLDSGRGHMGAVTYKKHQPK